MFKKFFKSVFSIFTFSIKSNKKYYIVHEGDKNLTILNESLKTLKTFKTVKDFQKFLSK